MESFSQSLTVLSSAQMIPEGLTGSPRLKATVENRTWGTRRLVKKITQTDAGSFYPPG